jgi:Tol biopolymer transport system component
MSDPVERLNAALEGRYEIERELGEGGMATVYLATDLKHNRNVALKVLKPELAAVVGAERFLAEIETTANLTHPHILPLFDSGEADSFLFYVMPHIEGETLRERIDREKQLPVDEAVKIATDLAEALDYAHRHKIIHRDIKPANILIHEGRPLIADFGIALAVGVAGGGRLTETGLSVGTPHYMSPEQATGDQAVGVATDIYALGAVLYEMLVGEPPYTGSTAQAILGKIIQGKLASATEERASVPANVDAAIRKALEKLPADRFTGAQEFVGALGDEHFRYGETLVASAAVGSPGPWKWASLVLVVIAILMTTGWAVSTRERTEPRPRARFELSLDEGGVIGTAGSGVDITISTDGSRIVYRGPSAAGSQLWERSMNGLVPLPITGTEAGQAPALSPDGMSVVFSGGGQPLRVKSLSGGPSTELVDGGTNATYGADGMLYYRMAGTGIVWRMPVTGGEAEAFTSEMEGVDLKYMDALPGGSGLLVTIGRGDLLQSGIGVVGPEGGEVRELFAGAMARYAESGHIVYTTADGILMAARFDLGSLEVTGAPVAMLDGVRVKSGSASQFALSETGTLVYREGGSGGGGAGDSQLITVDLEGNEEPLVLGPRNIGTVSWSPDGQSVVYSSDNHIYTYNVALGTTPRQLTFEGINSEPVFSPDGTRVAFSSGRQGTGDQDLFVKNLDDDLPPRSIITLERNQSVTQWPSDSLIVFERGEGGNGDLWMVDLSDPDDPRAEDYLSSEANLRSMVVSPDGTLAAYRSNESGPDEIYIRSFPEPGGLTIVSEGGGDVPFWSPDGNTLYYTRPPGVFTAARIERDPVPVVVSRDSLFTVTPGIGRVFQGSGLHPDGDRFILARTVDTTDDAPQRLILVLNFFEELKERVPN